MAHLCVNLTRLKLKVDIVFKIPYLNMYMVDSVLYALDHQEF